MTGWEIIHDVRDVLTATAAIVAGIKAWAADKKSKRIESAIGEIKIALAQQQAQRQAQNITVNVGTTGGAGTVPAQPITFSDPDEEGQ
jgi:hypothetical protein